MGVAELVDSIVAARVLVHGSLPPHGRDLDVLARPPEHEAIETRLGELGFVRKGHELALFKDCTVELVDMAPSSWWQLPDDEIEAVYDDALPIEGYVNLVRPSAHHMLLILTRRLVEGKGFIDAKRRRYLDRALEDDPGAWDKARARAGVWGAGVGLALLRSMYDRGEKLSRSRRAEAIAERLESLGVSPARARAAAWKRTIGRPRRGAVVALSGVDGSGKSTQAARLAETLVRLGFDAHEQWTKLGETPWIWRIARPAKRVLLFVTRSGSKSTLPPPSSERYGPDAGTELRRRSPALTHAWATFVALSNVLTHRRATSRSLQGAVVVCDRYVLDSIVHLRARYGPERSFAFQAALVRRLSPKPAPAFLIHVTPEVAHERRRDEHELEELADLVRLYDEELSRVSVRVIDGTRTMDEVCADLAREIWLAL